jgi:hypothetical protein
MKIWRVTEKTSVRATVNYEVRTSADGLRGLVWSDYKLCKCAIVLYIWGLRPDLYYMCDSYGLVLVGRPL